MSSDKKKNPFSDWYGKGDQSESFNDKDEKKDKFFSEKPSEINIMAEIVTETARKGPMAMRSDFSNYGFNVEKVIGTGPKKQGPELASPSEDTLVVTGTIPEEKINELKNDPRVKRVNRTPKFIAPFSCPIPPCDCTSDVSKGALLDVAQYLE
jgi:hypothetical protein